MNNNQNPLKNYFRNIKYYVTLPSKGKFYDDSIVEVTSEGEVGVLAMTAKDELLYQNPEALINGEAKEQTLKSCIPSIKNLDKMLICDIEALFVAIRHATYGENLKISSTCTNEKCKHENHYDLTTMDTLENIKFIEDIYVVNDKNLSIFLKPYLFLDYKKQIEIQIEQNKIIRTFSNQNISEEEKTDLFKNSFEKIGQYKIEFMALAIDRIVNVNDNINVSDKKFISEFLENCDSSVTKEIEAEIEKMNGCGIPKKYKFICEKCETSWESPINFNTEHFFNKP